MTGYLSRSFRKRVAPWHDQAACQEQKVTKTYRICAPHKDFRNSRAVVCFLPCHGSRCRPSETTLRLPKLVVQMLSNRGKNTHQHGFHIVWTSYVICIILDSVSFFFLDKASKFQYYVIALLVCLQCQYLCSSANSILNARTGY